MTLTALRWRLLATVRRKQVWDVRPLTLVSPRDCSRRCDRRSLSRSRDKSQWAADESVQANRNQKEANPIRIALEGNIAAGKSTYLNILRQAYLVTCVDEPVGKWQNIASDGDVPMGNNLLDLFYKDPNRWAYTFQSYAFLSRMEAHLEALKNNEAEVLVMERSIHSDKQIFATNCWKNGLFNDVEWSIYCEWHSWILSKFDSGLHGLVYLRTRPETCLQRLQKRARAEESAIPLQYLQEIHERHEDWLVRGSTGEHTPPVLVLDCDADFQKEEERRAQLLAQTRAFMAQLGGEGAHTVDEGR